MDEIVDNLNQNIGETLDNTIISNLMFADNTILFREAAKDLQEDLDRFSNATSVYGLTLNEAKCKADHIRQRKKNKGNDHSGGGFEKRCYQHIKFNAKATTEVARLQNGANTQAVSRTLLGKANEETAEKDGQDNKSSGLPYLVSLFTYLAPCYLNFPTPCYSRRIVPRKNVA